MTSVSAGHITLTLTQSVGSGQPLFLVIDEPVLGAYKGVVVKK